jgi:AcrR family transcriptional regulator
VPRRVWCSEPEAGAAAAAMAATAATTASIGHGTDDKQDDDRTDDGGEPGAEVEEGVEGADVEQGRSWSLRRWRRATRQPHRWPCAGAVSHRRLAGTSVGDLAGILGVSKAVIYYHYRSKDTLLHRLVDPLLDAIDACIDAHSTPNRPGPGPVGSPAARELLRDYLAVLTAHQEVVPLVTTDIAVLNHPTIGPRIRAQDQRLRTLLAAPDTSAAATLRAEAALGAIRLPLTTQAAVDLTDASHRQTLIDAAFATLKTGQTRRSSNRDPEPPTRTDAHTVRP